MNRQRIHLFTNSDDDIYALSISSRLECRSSVYMHLYDINHNLENFKSGSTLTLVDLGIREFWVTAGTPLHTDVT